MLGPSVEKLLEISTSPLVDQAHELPHELLKGIGENLTQDLAELLRRKNGFLAFESALLVRPSFTTPEHMSLQPWNNPENWRAAYDRFEGPLFFFAEDLFACQFALSDNGIKTMNPETGQVEQFAESIENWAKRILDDYSVHTGWSLAQEWQEKNGPLENGFRMLPKTPFVLGGDYVVENLTPIPEFFAISKLGELYRRIRDLPDGESITIQNWFQ